MGFTPSNDPDYFSLNEECTNYPASRVIHDSEYGTNDCIEKYVALYTTYSSKTAFFGEVECTTQTDIFTGEETEECSSNGGKCMEYMNACWGSNYGGNGLSSQCTYYGAGASLGENPPITFQGATYYNFVEINAPTDWTYGTQGFQADDISSDNFWFDFATFKDCAATVDDALANAPLVAQMNYYNGDNAFSEGAASFFSSLGDYLWSVVLGIAASIFFCIACCCASGCCGGNSTVVVVQGGTE